MDRRDFLKSSLGASLFLALGNPQLSDSKLHEGVYFQGWKGVSKEGVDQIFAFMEENDLNTFMVDLKNAHGNIFYKPSVPLAGEIGGQVRTREGRPVSLQFDYLREQAAERDYTMIGRHVMFWDEKLFQKEELRLLDMNGQKWVDMRDSRVVEYNLELLREESDMGFDELVLDYIRFPATSQFGTNEEKADSIDGIVERCSEAVETELGVQVFGYSAWRSSWAGVGQRLTTLDPNVDTIYPMLYPSHFREGSFGYENPEQHPYELISRGVENALEKAESAAIVPMLQGFEYGPREHNLQIEAALDSGSSGFVFWNPSNKYTALSEAVDMEEVATPEGK